MEFFNSPAYVSLMSRGPDLASVYQGALTLKEVARMAAEATSAAQFRHGPIEIVNPAHRYVIFARQGPPGHRTKTAKLLVRLAEEIRSHGGRILLLTDLPFESSSNMRVVEVEAIPFGIGTLIDTLHIQLLAHDLAVRAGLEPGKFWIAEEVTKAVMATLSYGKESISVGIEDVEPKDWTQKVYKPDILSKLQTIYKKPGYTPQ